MVICERCGTDLPDNAKYCLNCGRRIGKIGKTFSEDFYVNADDLVKRVRDLLNEGNVTRIIVRDELNNVLLDIPVTAGLLGVVLAPWLAAVGAVAAFVTNCRITVERKSSRRR